MSDKFKGFVVVLKENVDEHYAENLRKAIQCFEGVITVENVPVTTEDYFHKQRVKNEILNKLYEVILEK